MDKQDTVTKDRRLVDRITYLGSLASDSKVIDEMLDTLREITVRWDSSAPLGENDRKHLDSLEVRLKDFLITKDPLRSFTAEELEDRLRLREAKTTIVNKFAIAAAASFAIAGLVYLIPSNRLTLEYKTLVAASIQMLIAQLTTVWLYMSNLSNFKKEFRQAYVFIAFSVLPIGVLFTQIALVQVLGIGDAAPFQYAGVSYFATLMFVLMYIGFRKYALLLKIKSRLNSAVGVSGFLALMALLAVVMPHPSQPHSLLFFNLSVASIMIIFFLAIINAILIHKIMRVITSAYRKPLFILYIYMYAAIFGAAVANIALYLLGELSAGSLTLVIILAAIPQQLLLLYSGYLFDKYIGR